jgi:eukaryotic-like serine/threonine-protein kinase
VLGSPEYMSPEQAQGLDDLDERTDVWSFCIVLYEMLTGTTPFKTSNYNSLMQAIINKPALPITDFGVGDEAIWRVLERGLKKDRDERWSNMTELGEGLALWLYEHGIKEDLSGNSVRALWLDTGLGGVRIDVPESSFPIEHPRRPPPVITEEQLEDLPQQYLVTDRPASNTAQSSITQIGRRHRRHKQKIIVLSAAAVTLLVAAVLFIAFRSRPTTVVVTAPESQTSATAQTPPRSPSGTPEPDQKDMSSAADVERIPILPPLATDPKGSSTPSTAAPKRPVIKSAAPNKPVPRNGKRSHDFGF